MPMVLWEALLPCVHDVPGFSTDLETIAFQAIARVGLQSDITVTYFQILSNALSAVILSEMY